MAKRRTTLDDLIELASKLPWQVGVGLAVGSEFVLHLIAGFNPPIQDQKNPGDMGSVVVHLYALWIAFFLQFVVPPGLLIGALVSFLNKKKRNSLFGAAIAKPEVTATGMSWREFEMLVGEAFRREGYLIEERGGAAPDGGIDLVATKAGNRYLIQCKQWRARQVGVSVVRELNGVVAAEGAHGGIVVTNGQFTREAQEFAESCDIRLIDGNTLRKQFRRVGARPVPTLEGAKTRSKPSIPNCPDCGSIMVQRQAKKGAHTGKPFWGCPKYPKCRGIVDIP